MNSLFRFSILFLGWVILFTLGSCHKSKTTESIITNQTSYDFTISFNKRKKGHVIKRNSKKTVYVGEEEYPQLIFPFDSDTVVVELDNEKKLYFARSKMDEENNIFNTSNWTYVSYTNYYTDATYTFTNKILTNMLEMP